MSDWLDKLEAKKLESKKFNTLQIIPTKYPELNKALGINGFPKGKIIEIAGAPGIGKGVMIADTISVAQTMDLNVVYLDLDKALDAQFLKDKEVNIEELVVFSPDPLEPTKMIEGIKYLTDAKLVDLIIIDTISQCVHGIPSIMAELAKIVTDTNITIIIASQIRHNWEDPRDYNTPYMSILNQYCHIRMMVKKIESIKDDSILIGRRLSVDVYKNTMFRPNSTEIEIYF